MRRACPVLRRRVCDVLLLSLMLSLAACAGTRPEYVTIPFEYPSLQAGSEGVRDTVVLRPGEEQRTVSDAVYRAVQSLELSIISPKAAAGSLLPTEQMIDTDYVSLNREAIEGHNKSSNAAKLQMDRLYRISYHLQYSLAEKRIDLAVNALLQQRGSGGEWRDLSSDYSATYFVGKLRSAIEGALRRAGDGP